MRALLRQHGCRLVRQGKGDHEIWFSPITKRHITVDARIKSRHTAKAILRQAGIDQKH
ncbi:MAG: type II toxin-antitoxin system HicA family toxin [Alphaproteobacteria bacterium]|nr:type II toxin-antitoxin system HicA family toxin [Alphaproteobacteria bacterium]